MTLIHNVVQAIVYAYHVLMLVFGTAHLAGLVLGKFHNGCYTKPEVGITLSLDMVMPW